MQASAKVNFKGCEYALTLNPSDKALKAFD